MKSFRFDMWQSGRKILLKDLIDSFGISKDLTWILWNFSGSGDTPHGENMESFEKKIRNLPNGYKLDKNDFFKFTNGLTDITSIKLTGVLAGRPVIEISGVDSTYWQISIDIEGATKPQHLPSFEKGTEGNS